MASEGEDSPKLRYVQNPYIETMDEDILFHLNMSTKTHNFKELFGDVKFVCIGGSPSRMLTVAKYLAQELSYHVPSNFELTNMTKSSDRFVLYKVGPVISASHGVGVPSMSVLLLELLKLLSHAEAKDVTLFRLGTSGGIGVEPGTVVVTSEPLNGLGMPKYEQIILGERVTSEAVLDEELGDSIKNCQPADLDFDVVRGKTICANDFYQEQGRVDGAICNHTEEDKFRYLEKLQKLGVRNFEMECVALAAITRKVKLKAAVVCVTLLNRMKGDQVTTPHSTLTEYEKRPAMVVARYMLNELQRQQN
ncbi:uridine phosphorylase 1-like [Watersipora subatra]|uniref:uridine phosphorylase 1-like n=1 Tax=Watersipora subatra TaxID=2589382 RepID=UPI00355BE197